MTQNYPVPAIVTAYAIALLHLAAARDTGRL